MRHPFACLALVLPALAFAQSSSPQSRMEADCLDRLHALIPPNVKTAKVDFSALGNYGNYFVVSYRFTGDLKNGARMAACTYLSNGRWVRDDGTAHTLAREHEAARVRAKSP